MSPSLRSGLPLAQDQGLSMSNHKTSKRNIGIFLFVLSVIVLFSSFGAPREERLPGEERRLATPTTTTTMKQRGRCAIVYSSGSLLKHPDGFLIDSHDTVIRLNKIETVGYEAYVGTKETIRAVHCGREKEGEVRDSPAEVFAKRNDSSIEGISFRWRFGAPNEHATWMKLKETTVSEWTYGPKQLEDDCFKLTRGLGGCSIGMLTVMWALEQCTDITVFGAIEYPCHPYHYDTVDDVEAFHKSLETSCKMPLHYHTAHNFNKEHEILKQYHRQGNVTINRFDPDH